MPRTRPNSADGHRGRLEVRRPPRLGFSMGNLGVTGLIAMAHLLAPPESALAAIRFEFGQYRAGEATGFAWVGVVRDPDSTETATVELATAAQTATAALDYAEVRTTVTFAPGEALQVVAIPILNDALREAGESLQVRLSNATGEALGLPTQATVTITDNDAGVRFQTSQVWAHEDLELVELRVLRGGDPASDAFSVDYSFSDLTATAGADFEGTSGTLTFAAGEMSKSVLLRVLNDGSKEADERFVVRLANVSSGRSLGNPSAATVTIVDATGMEPRRFDPVIRSSEDAVQLALVGGVPGRFRANYSIFQLEASADLGAWERLPLIGHPNASMTPPTLSVSGVATAEHRFFRLVSTPLMSPDPQPTGVHAVGLTRRLITDPSRRNRFGISSNATFRVNIWYPSDVAPGRPLEPILEKELVVVEAAGRPDVMDRLPRFVSYSTLDQPLAVATGRGWPVILVSHGAGGFRAQNQSFAQNLASHGYVVAAPDHHDAFAVLLPDGEIYRSSTSVAINPANSQDRVKDLIIILDQLEAMNREDPILRGGMDLGHVGAAGYSWGAPTAGEFCRIDSRCRAVVSLEWGTGTTGGFPDLVRNGLQKPSLMMNAPGNPSDYLFSKAMTNAVWMQISRTTHEDFVLAPWLTGGDSSASAEAVRTILAYAVSFFNRHLKAKDDHLLDAESSEFPRVVGFRRK